MRFPGMSHQEQSYCRAIATSISDGVVREEVTGMITHHRTKQGRITYIPTDLYDSAIASIIRRENLQKRGFGIRGGDSLHDTILQMMIDAQLTHRIGEYQIIDD